ncbi:unnamed protein product, partial [marine sediment metagenome]
KKLRMIIIIIAILFIGGFIGLCILLSSMDWTKIIEGFYILTSRFFGKIEYLKSIN